MNAFNKKFVPAFCNFFLKIKLNCDKENLVKFKYVQFSKEMLSNLACVLITK